LDETKDNTTQTIQPSNNIDTIAFSNSAYFRGVEMEFVSDKSILHFLPTKNKIKIYE